MSSTEAEAGAPPSASGPSSRSAQPSRPSWLRRAGAPVWVFAAVEVYALVQWLVIGRGGWFYLDEWDFIVSRKAGDLGDLFRSHNGHWVTLPVLVYRLLYGMFGLRTYLPYRLVGLAVYLLAAALLLVVMRRAQVNPWIATAAASTFALFGAGWQNVIRPFQITFVGSLVFGLVHLLLSDHDGPFDRRDRLGLLAGLLGLMTSGVAVVMVLIVAISVLWRRGWKLAFLHAAPPALAYLVWRVVIGHKGDVPHHMTVGGMLRFVGSGARGTFERIGPFRAFGFVLVLVLVVGLVLAVGQRRASEGVRSLCVPVSLLGGTIVFLLVTGTTRSSNGSTYALQSRYLSLVAALILPALAVTIDAIARRWRWFLPLGIVLLLVGIPHNLQGASSSQKPLTPFYAATKRLVATIPHDPVARLVAPTLAPERVAALSLTVGWLLDASAQGRLPSAGVLTTRDLQADNFRLSFDQRLASVPTTGCVTLSTAHSVRLKRGALIGVSVNSLLVTPAGSPALVFPGLVFAPSDTMPVVVVRKPGRVLLSAYQPGASSTSEPKGGWPRVCLG